MAADPIREHVAGQIAVYEPITVLAPDRRGRLRPRKRHRLVKAGWSPIDALEYAKDRDTVTVFRECVMLVRLCGDEKARLMPEHALIHRAVGLTECVGPAILVRTAESLGIDDLRARRLVQQLDQEWAAAEGLAGTGER